MTTASHLAPRRLAHPAAFVLFVFVWTWSFWLTAILNGFGTDTPTGMALALGGLLGPTVGGIGFTLLTRDRAGQRDYWLRFVDPRRIPVSWYPAIVLLVPALMGATALLDLASGGAYAPYAERATEFFADSATIAPTLLAVLLLGPMPEEFGWHGYLLDRLQERHNRLVSSLWLGMIWAAWHLPLFFLPGTYQHEQGAFGIWFWTFMAGIVPLSVVMAWIFNNTNRSTLAIITFHFVVVVTCNFLNATPGANIISTGLWIAVAILVSLGRRRQPLATPAPAA